MDDKLLLEADLRLECYTAEWTAYAVVAGLGVCMYPIGIAVFFAASLFFNRSRVHLAVDAAKHEVGVAIREYERLQGIVESGAGEEPLIRNVMVQLVIAKQRLQEAQFDMEHMWQQLPAHEDVQYR